MRNEENAVSPSRQQCPCASLLRSAGARTNSYPSLEGSRGFWSTTNEARRRTEDDDDETTKRERQKKALSSIKQRRRLPRAPLPSEPRSGPLMPIRPCRNEEPSFFCPEAAATGATKSRQRAPGRSNQGERVECRSCDRIAGGGDGLSRMRKQKAKAPPSPFSSHCCDREGRCSGSQKHGNFSPRREGASEPDQQKGGILCSRERAGGGGRRESSGVEECSLVVRRLSAAITRPLALPRQCADESLLLREQKGESELPVAEKRTLSCSLTKETS